MAIGAALLTAGVGLSAALGGFLAGLVLAESEYRHQLEVDIEPFKGLLLGLFFMTVGMSLDLKAIPISLPAFAAAIVTLIVIKGIVMYGGARFFGVAPAVALESGFLLAGAGEFAFVVFTLARSERLVDPAFLQFLVSVSALSMMLVPFLGYSGRHIGSWLAARELRPVAWCPQRRAGRIRRSRRHRGLWKGRQDGGAHSRSGAHPLCRS